jgi:hypothetical protein
VVRTPVRFAFETVDRVENWPQINPSCQAVDILGREGQKTTFRFVASDGREWVSSHYASPDGDFSFTERHDPTPPVAAFQCTRTYRQLDSDSTTITEEITCALADGCEDQELPLAAAIDAHARQIQPVMRAQVEARYAEAHRAPAVRS